MEINDHQRKKLLMVEQILLIFTSGDVCEQYGEFALWGFRVNVVSSAAVSWSRHALRDWLTYDNIWFLHARNIELDLGIRCVRKPCRVSKFAEWKYRDVKHTLSYIFHQHRNSYYNSLRTALCFTFYLIKIKTSNKVYNRFKVYWLDIIELTSGFLKVYIYIFFLI